MIGRTIRWLLALGRFPEGRRGRPRVTIVRHHRVFGEHDRPLQRLGVTASVLERQVTLLSRAGMTPITVADALARRAAGEPGRHVAFSFDDGYEDNLTRGIPVLAKHGARATFYLTSGLMTERRAPWWDELAFVLENAARKSVRLELGGRSLALELGSPEGRAAALGGLLPLMRVPPAEQRARLDALREATGTRSAAPCELATWERAGAFAADGMEAGAHTLSHPFLSLLDSEAQQREIAGSIQVIRERLGVGVLGLAYPNGDHDDVTVAAARTARLEYAVTTRAGDVTADVDPFRIPRRGFSEGACLGPTGRFSDRLALAEVSGAFDGLRGVAQEEST